MVATCRSDILPVLARAQAPLAFRMRRPMELTERELWAILPASPLGF